MGNTYKSLGPPPPGMHLAGIESEADREFASAVEKERIAREIQALLDDIRGGKNKLLENLKEKRNAND